MNWYEWDSLGDFNQWHDALCLTLGYPETPRNQLTGLLDESAQKTTAYTLAFEVKGKWIAEIENQYTDGLTITALRQPVRISS